MPRAGAVDRVQEVYATSYRRLVGQLTGVTGDPAEAEDAVMEAFARAATGEEKFLIPLEEMVHGAAVTEAIIRSAETHQVEKVR